MRSVPKILLMLALLGVGAVLASYHVANQHYYPVSKLASSDGYTFTLVQNRVQARGDCGAANDRVIDPLKKTCPQCEVVYARCERELRGLELALLMGDPVPYYVVTAPNLRLVVEGPAHTLQRDCEYIAERIVKAGVRAAACVFPNKLRTP